MFPLRDSIPRVHTPYVVYGLLVANLLVFLFQQTLGPQSTFQFLHTFGVVPARFTAPDWAIQMGYPAKGYYAFVTHLFLHGDWMHFIVNMWSLWIFADNIEDVMGVWRFLAFYITCGLAAVFVHVFFNITATIPVVGASGAIAGVMGAYFLLYPHAKVTTLIPILIIPFFIDLPAVLYLGIWFGSQLISGIGSLSQEGSVAWWAHAGGFIAGMVLLPLFRRKGRCYYCRMPEGNPHKARRETPQPIPPKRRNRPVAPHRTMHGRWPE